MKNSYKCIEELDQHFNSKLEKADPNNYQYDLAFGEELLHK